MIRRSRHLSLTIFPLLLLLLFTCAVATAACTERVLTEFPAGVTVDVYQGRFDTGDHKLAVAVNNSTTLPFTVLALSFSSPAFLPPTSYDRAPTTVRPGTSTDLRLLLPAADCTAPTGTPRVTVRFAFGDRDGSRTTGTATLTPRDRIGQLPAIIAEDCRDDSVAAVAAITPASNIRFIQVAGKPTAVLDFTATPTGAGGVLVLDDVRGTVLLGALDPATGKVGDTVPLGLDIGAATHPVKFPVVLVPARCDPHVVLEDKRGTIFTFTVTTRRDTGRIFLGVSDTVRVQLYDYVGARCGWS